MNFRFDRVMCWAHTTANPLTSFRIKWERQELQRSTSLCSSQSCEHVVGSEPTQSHLIASVLQTASWNAFEVPSLQCLEMKALPLRNMHHVIQTEHNVLSLIVLWRSRLCHRLCQEYSKEGDDFSELTSGLRGLETFMEIARLGICKLEAPLPGHSQSRLNS